MFVAQCKNIIESEESSDEEVVSFTRRIINRISSNSDSDDEESYASEDLEKMLEELAIAEEEELTNAGDFWTISSGTSSPTSNNHLHSPEKFFHIYIKTNEDIQVEEKSHCTKAGPKYKSIPPHISINTSYKAFKNFISNDDSCSIETSPEYVPHRPGKPEQTFLGPRPNFCYHLLTDDMQATISGPFPEFSIPKNSVSFKITIFHQHRILPTTLITVMTGLQRAIQLNSSTIIIGIEVKIID
ncbi:hypothetical protein WN51_00378 [Melipona quadrifasciata]|uniref:Uncharacterized protein n=1 Tax=Melipona quadrifasciata TaxID=166423 RepID=A0A0M9A244_9HYME|nr:hypothetical protein WN51_00378 [Melipona quadrifasciata]